VTSNTFESTPTPTTAQGDLNALAALVIDNEDLAELEQLLAGFNLFESLGNIRREERHSDFLAFLLSPLQPHGLGDAVLRSFVQVAIAAEPEQGGTIERIDAALFDLAESRVEREWGRIDILVVSEAEKFIVLIENKIDTGEHSNQLQRYIDVVQTHFVGWKVLPVFLTRYGQMPSHPAYHPVSYQDVHTILRRLLDRQRASMPTDIEVAVRHYCEMLERHILENTRIAELARKIYRHHQRALDIIFEHRPDAQELLRQAIVAVIKQDTDLRLVYDSKNNIQFVPREWDKFSSLKRGSDGSWLKQSELLRFEFRPQNGLSLHLVIGPANTNRHRSRLHAESGREEHSNLFKNRNKTLYTKWTQIWGAPIVSKAEDPDLLVDQKIEKFKKEWEILRKQTLPQLFSVISQLYSRKEGNDDLVTVQSENRSEDAWGSED
jgi:hypothetical protein